MGSIAEAPGVDRVAAVQVAVVGAEVAEEAGADVADAEGINMTGIGY